MELSQKHNEVQELEEKLKTTDRQLQEEMMKQRQLQHKHHEIQELEELAARKLLEKHDEIQEGSQFSLLVVWPLLDQQKPPHCTEKQAAHHINRLTRAKGLSLNSARVQNVNKQVPPSFGCLESKLGVFFLCGQPIPALMWSENDCSINHSVAGLSGDQVDLNKQE